MQSESPPTSHSLRRKLGIDALHVFVLSSFAVAQPLYDLLGRNATFFVARGSKPVDMFLFVLGLSFLLPAILAACLVLSRALGARFYTAAFAVLQIALVTSILLPPTKTLPVWAAMLVSAGCGLLFALAYRRLRVVSMSLTALSPAILFFPAFFLFATPASKVAFPKDVSAAEPTLSLPPESNVVFLLFDLLPVTALMDENQNLDAERYPGFARLLAQSVWYRQARTVNVATAKAVPALLSGRYPEKRGLPLLEHYPNNLFTLFGTAGDIHAFEAITRLCPEALCGGNRSLAFLRRLSSLAEDTTIVFSHLLLPEPLAADRLPPIDSDWGSFGQTVSESAEDPVEEESEREKRARLKKELLELVHGLAAQDRLRKFEIFLMGLGRPASRNLSFLHLDLPHGPFLYLSSGKKYVPSALEYKKLKLQAALGKGERIMRKSAWGPEQYLVDLAYQRLTHQIMLADQLVSQLLDRLEELSTLDRSLLIITADHGQSYEPYGFLRSLTDADTAHVPLFIKFPGQRDGVVDDRAVETIDILPTIVDVLDLELDWQFDGFSLVAGSVDEASIAQRKPTTLNRDLDTHLRLKLDRTGKSSRDIPGIGPHRRFVGQQVAEALATAHGDEALSRLEKVALDQAALLESVDVNSDFVPAYLTGSVEIDEEAPRIDLAVALNGVIRTTLTTYQTKKGVKRFATLVPESSFLDGNNTWEFFRFPGESRVPVAALPAALEKIPQDTRFSPSEQLIFADGFESGGTRAWR